MISSRGENWYFFKSDSPFSFAVIVILSPQYSALLFAVIITFAAITPSTAAVTGRLSSALIAAITFVATFAAVSAFNKDTGTASPAI